MSLLENAKPYRFFGIELRITFFLVALFFILVAVAGFKNSIWISMLFFLISILFSLLHSIGFCLPPNNRNPTQTDFWKDGLEKIRHLVCIHPLERCEEDNHHPLGSFWPYEIYSNRKQGAEANHRLLFYGRLSAFFEGFGQGGQMGTGG